MSMSGLYGLKTDVHDITELIDDLSLNDLLDGIHKCASLGKEKGRKLTNVNENIMNSIRKACPILQPPRSSQSQSYMEIDTCSSEKMPLYNSTSVSVALNGENGDSPAEHASASNKVSQIKLEYCSIESSECWRMITVSFMFKVSLKGRYGWIVSFTVNSLLNLMTCRIGAASPELMIIFWIFHFIDP